MHCKKVQAFVIERVQKFPSHEDDAISINHNWFNAYNLSWVWNLLVKDYKEAKKYIEDIRDICDDFEGLCQRNLAANTGMNFPDFFNFISRFAVSNMTHLFDLLKSSETTIMGSLTKVLHLVSNLVYIRKVAMSMKLMEFFSGENMEKFLLESPFSDLRKLPEEPEFLELCMTVGSTYDKIDRYERQGAETENSSSCLKHSWFEHDFKANTGDIDLIKISNISIAGPEDLVRILDDVITNFKAWPLVEL